MTFEKERIKNRLESDFVKFIEGGGNVYKASPGESGEKRRGYHADPEKARKAAAKGGRSGGLRRPGDKIKPAVVAAEKI